MSDQTIVFATLAGALVAFGLNRWRYDFVAITALLVLVVTGVVEAADAFFGFGHPAVITVAAVLVSTRGLQNSGVVDTLARWMGRLPDRLIIQLFALTGVAGLCSAFMNNVGALALLMPVAIRLARKSERSPSVILMPLAFGSLLGGMTTLIGTPPNIIIAGFRATTDGNAFRLFDFSPVGAVIAVGGVIFLSLVGWRLIPTRKGRTGPEDLLQIEDYMTEVRVPDGSPLVGRLVRDLEEAAVDGLIVIGLVRSDLRQPAPSKFMTLRAEDILIVEAPPESLQGLVDTAGLELVGNEELHKDALGSDEVSVIEAVVTPGSLIAGRTGRELNFRGRYGVNLLAVARQGSRLRSRLDSTRFRVGDVLLLQGWNETLYEAMRTLGCMPLVERGLRLGLRRRANLSMAVFIAAIAVAALGLLNIQIALVAGAGAMVLLGLVSPRETYESVDWTVIVLLGAMIPVGQALNDTGGAALVAGRLLDVSGNVAPVLALSLLMVVTMFLSDLVNNAAAALLMAPIAISIAWGLDVSTDTFLMAVAIGASSAFLTPIGHQSNTLVMGPGGYRFWDYWRVGLPLELLILALALPMLLLVWPL